MYQRSVSNVIYKNLQEYSQVNKKHLNKIFNLCDITPYELERNDGRISESKHLALQTMMANDSGNENFIINHVLNNSLSTAYQLFPDLIGLCMNQENLGSAIMRFTDNSCIIGNCDYFTVERNDSHIKVSYLSNSPEEIQKINSISNIVLLSDLIRIYSPCAIQNVSLTAKSLQNKSLFDDKFNNKCLINQNENHIIIDNSYLKNEYSSYNHHLSLLQKEKIENLKYSIVGADTFHSSVSEIILDIVYSKKMSEQNQVLRLLCDILNISRWTLNRRLKSENTNFKALYLDTKIKVSVKLLMETNLSIQEISDWLAFSSHSAFTRFFRAKMLVSPTAYRNRFLAAEANMNVRQNTSFSTENNQQR